MSIVQADGFQWVSRPGTDDGIGYNPHEANLEPTLRELLPDGGVVLDVGAHVGRWTVRLAGKASKVIAVEANPDTADALLENLRLNGITNVDIVNVAAWDRDERLVLADPHGRFCSGTARTLPGDAGTVWGRRLDDVLRDVDRVDLVKLDVEGADIKALNGMTETLQRLSPALFIELHDVLGYYARPEMEETLMRLGYRWGDDLHYSFATYLVAEKGTE